MPRPGLFWKTSVCQKARRHYPCERVQLSWLLSAASLLRVINENSLAQARDCNPLTKLAGNSSIASYVSEACPNTAEDFVLAYMDLDNFKAFNDAYGFRQGDRAILLFAELMRKQFQQDNIFLGHVGGDDFFVA